MENTEPPNPTSSEDLQPQNFGSPTIENTPPFSVGPTDQLSAAHGFHDFDARNVAVERIAGLIFTGVVVFGAIVGIILLFMGVGLGWIFYGLLTAAIIVIAVLLWSTIVWPGIEHRHRSWRLTDVGLEVRHGVWWKHMQAIPWARVQHADVSQGPLQRMYSVGTLTVHTAGTSNSSVNLAGLSHEVAIELRDEIIRQRTVGDVV
jgi:membrane protein YdbS with pleckstrin-like domain